jgi:hypothetical protein
MEDLELLTMDDLVDLLNEQMSYYHDISRGGGSKEQFDSCNRFMQELQVEISRRTSQLSAKHTS